MKNPKDGLPILTFKSPKEFNSWLKKNYSKSNGFWLRFYKKASMIKSIVYKEAVDEALCYGWIDSLVKSYDEKSYIQKFTPRRARSVWSQVNREKVAQLIKERRMTSAGLAEVNRAKKDGRWAAAYASSKTMVMPKDFLQLLKKKPKARKFYETLNKSNRYAIAWQLHHAKKPETRIRRMQKFISMLEKGEKLY